MTAAVSSYATGGGGFTLERRVAVRYLAAMLSGGARQELDGHRVVRVAFQQSQVSPVDDLHVLGARDGEDEPSLELWVAARRSPRFVRSDPRSQELMASLVQASRLPEEPGRNRRLVVCVVGFENRAPIELAKLTDLAREKLSDESFRTALDSASTRIRDRFGHLEDLVRASVGEGSEFSIWHLLRRLHVVMTRLEPPDEEDWVALLGELQSWSRDQAPTGAEALASHLMHLADQYGPAAAEVNRARLCRDAHSFLHNRRRRLAAAWRELWQLEEEARGYVRSRCGSDPAVTLPRDAARDDLVRALASARVLSVSGKSGTGKSALVCAALDKLREASSDSFELLYLSLRLLPSSAVEMRSVIGAPFDEVFSEMSAPTRMLVIDASDRAAEVNNTPLAAIVRDAVGAGVSVCVVSASEASEVVEGIVEGAAGESPHRLIVSALTNDEVHELARALPILRDMAASPRTRELLQLPLYADLLSWSSIGDAPLSESAAMDVIWDRRIRGELSRSRGTPDARDQAMRQLALHELTPSDPDHLYASLDGAALDGLRRDGIVRDSGRTSPLPAFAHDILRDFAVAKVLTSTNDPVERLQSFNAPRIAIPAARLALESLIQGSADGAAVLDQLQRSCDELAASGAGDRWGDLPMEVTLNVPEARELLAGSWGTLTAGGGGGLKRALRLMAQRHMYGGIADVQVSAPLALLLVERGWPRELQAPVESFLAAWLRGLATQAAPEGNAARVGLRNLLEHKVATGAQLDQQQAQNAAATTLWAGYGDEPRLSPELTEESTLRFLALLGSDLGSSGETLLRRVAKRDPACLLAAVEEPGAGGSLAQHDSALLIDLVEAYYIDEDVDASGIRFHEDGIREHEFHGIGSPMAAAWYGPFVAMFTYDFVSGVVCLNRLLDHAAHVQARERSRPSWDDPNYEATEDLGVELSILGSPRRYAGVGNTWAWYRVVGSGPYPCTSALQALEFVCDQLLTSESIQPDELIRTLLSDCGNLAMVGLAYGIMVRHLERFQRSLDAFLVEPFVWEIEISRVVHESSGLVSNTPTAAAAERRQWTPHETVLRLVFAADETRAQELKVLGHVYLENATSGLEDVSDNPERLAVARKRALAFDRDEYEVTQSGDQVLVQQRIDPEVESALAESNRDLRRSMEAQRLLDRYAERCDQIRRPDPLDAEELRHDIATARDLIADPPPSGPLDSDAGAASVAAATIEGYFLDGIVTSADDVVWAAVTLTRIVQDRRNRLTAHRARVPMLFWKGADRGAGRGLPLLLREDARPTLSQLAAQGLHEEEIHHAVMWLFTRAPAETRYAASRALDSLWLSPCTESDPCPHRLALGFVEESLRYVTARRRQPFDEMPDDTPLSGPIVEAVASVEPERLVLEFLNAALRALGASIGAMTCINEPAARLLDLARSAHCRARLAINFGHHTDWDALFAARAVLQQAAAGNTSAVQEHIAAFADHFHGLQECLLALAAAAEESPQAAAAASAAWPSVIRDGLRFFEEASQVDSSRKSSRVQDQVFSALLPFRPSETRYMYREMPDRPAAWITPAGWESEIDQWVNVAVAYHESAASDTGAAPHTRRQPLPAGGAFGTIDALISMLVALEAEEQAKIGIHWVERLVVATGEAAATTLALPEWLRDVQPHCSPDEQQTWERIVDLLFVHGDPRVRGLAD